MCEGAGRHDCDEVTSGYYFTPDEVLDQTWEAMLYPVFMQKFRL